MNPDIGVVVRAQAWWLRARHPTALRDAAGRATSGCRTPCAAPGAACCR
jgi:hypothetical protein